MPLEQDLEPYEQTLKTMPARERAAWAQRVLAVIQTRQGADLRGLTFEFHAGAEHRGDLSPLLARSGAVCTCPAKNTKSPAPVAAARLATEPKRVMPGTRAGRAGFAEV